MASRAYSPKLTEEPISGFDVDADLWEVLNLCQDEELERIYDELFGQSPFSPVVKSVVAVNEPSALTFHGRKSVMHKIESRFRFLAADSLATLRGYRPTYKESLAHIRSKLGISCPPNLDTQDLEAEIFLHLLQNYQQDVLSISGDSEGAQAAAAVIEGDGMVPRVVQRRGSWFKKLTSPLKFGREDIMSTISKLGSAVTLSALRTAILEQMSSQLAARKIQYQMAMKVLCTEGVGCIRRRAAVTAAQRGVTMSAARFGAVKSALSMLGPMMWAWLGVDLALKSIGTDYARIVKTVFALAQVRLIHTQGVTTPKPSPGE